MKGAAESLGFESFVFDWKAVIIGRTDRRPVSTSNRINDDNEDMDTRIYCCSCRVSPARRRDAPTIANNRLAPLAQPPILLPPTLVHTRSVSQSESGSSSVIHPSTSKSSHPRSVRRNWTRRPPPPLETGFVRNAVGWGCPFPTRLTAYII